jgi:cyclophilin family peptidyl-prolyl cis-trans isomerase
MQVAFVGRLSLAALLVVLSAVSARTQEKTDTPRLRVSIRMAQTSYESTQLMRGELTIENLSDKWAQIPAGDELAKSLRLTGPDGKAFEPTKPEQFAATKSKELGPGGFVGIAFDAALLFPALQQPGNYTLAFKSGVLESTAALRIIAGFDPTKNYVLSLSTVGGDISIALDSVKAPMAARNMVNLARLGFFDGAAIPSVQAGEMVMVRGPVTATHRIVPFEPSTDPVLAGSVVLEPSLTGPGGRGSWPNLSLLLAPRPEWTGQVVVVGRVVAGMEALTKLASSPSSGKEGRPPYQPLAPLFVGRAVVSEAAPALDTTKN